MTREIILFTLLLVSLIGLLVFLRRREGRYLKKTTREALSPKLKEEIEDERRQNRERKQKFEEAMRRAGGA